MVYKTSSMEGEVMRDNYTAEMHRESLRKELRGREKENLLQGKSAKQCCIELKESLDYLQGWLEAIAFPEEHPSRSKVGPRWIAQELMRSHASAIVTVEHVIKLLDGGEK
jgi:hypothetical protein